ncbi:MAG: polyamine aminopropyltransferase [Spirochaetia bacterium]|nr:polyamine aminopropyltransferase [Spirochaetota bacterium]MCX8096918.1 polyamine aminopropyltransferase [Spirochaetota bacterium]MDW8112441.1 polyamine aminopropyltransferase [Spirochaetia bacterium]
MSYESQIKYFLRDDEAVGFNYEFGIKEIIYREKSNFQLIEIVDTVPFGRALITDSIVMITEMDEFIYHEMMTHVPMSLVEKPRKVLVIGGGDGGCVRELSKYPSLERIDLVEIDERIIDITQKYMNTWKGTNFNILNTYIEDGFKFIQRTNEKYDVIILDITAPVDIAIDLYSKTSFGRVVSRLTDEGVFVIQSESVFITPNVAKHILRQVRDLVRFSSVYSVYVPSFINPWSFVIGSKVNKPDIPKYENIDYSKVKFYTKEIHTSSFALPKFLKDFFDKEDDVKNLLDRSIVRTLLGQEVG